MSHSVKFKINTESINPWFSKTSHNKLTLLSKCALCCTEKSRFIKKQEASGNLSSLSLKTTLSKIQLFGNILFWMQFLWMIFANFQR